MCERKGVFLADFLSVKFLFLGNDTRFLALTLRQK